MRKPGNGIVNKSSVKTHKELSKSGSVSRERFKFCVFAKIDIE
jgi:hypothetical protein